MSKTRREFLTLLATNLPVVAVGTEIFDLPPATSASGESLDLWKRLEDLKNSAGDSQNDLVTGLSGHQVSLSGYLNELSEANFDANCFVLTPVPISCCVRCSIFGREAFAVVNAGSRVVDPTRLVNVKGRSKIGDKFPFDYLHLDDVQVS